MTSSFVITHSYLKHTKHTTLFVSHFRIRYLRVVQYQCMLVNFGHRRLDRINWSMRNGVSMEMNFVDYLKYYIFIF